ncbi:T9SS type A sorting domain-containing protein [Pseudofulvibacter geojedonensis]|uniref:T9SS type A sorting domain-containing protein n=1 Tax=Pseudofulvibacter geojedonensis TaxID=1123758 RepID=A0ABW3I3X5_9FLAO
MKLFIFKIIVIIPLLSSAQWTQAGNDINGEHLGDESGYAVSLSSNGSILAIGAPENDGNGNASGHVRVFQNTSGNWVQIGQDINGANPGDRFGYSVCLSGNGEILAVGTPYNDDNGSNAGIVRLFKKVGSNWLLINTFYGDSQGDFFGYAVSLSKNGNILVIGAPRAGTSSVSDGEGHIKLYEKVNGNWIYRYTIEGNQEQEYFGSALSLSEDGSVLAIGAHRWPSLSSSRGAVRVYKRLNNTNSWLSLGASIEGVNLGDEFGYSISLNSLGSILAIGVRRNDANGTNSGLVKTYELNASETAWVQLGNDIIGNSGDYLGSSISINSNGDLLAAGASEANSAAGLVRVYRNISGSWSQLGNDIVGENIQDFSASLGAIDLDSDGITLAVGAFGNDGNGSNSGHVRIFTNPILSITDYNYKKTIILHPNPINYLSILELGRKYNKVGLEFLNISGKLIKKENYVNVSKVELKTENLTKGVYFLKVKLPKEEATIRMIKK